MQEREVDKLRAECLELQNAKERLEATKRAKITVSEGKREREEFLSRVGSQKVKFVMQTNRNWREWRKKWNGNI